MNKEQQEAEFFRGVNVALRHTRLGLLSLAEGEEIKISKSDLIRLFDLTQEMIRQNIQDGTY